MQNLSHYWLNSRSRFIGVVLCLLLYPTLATADKVVVVPLVDERLPAIRPSAAIELFRFLDNDNFSRSLGRVLPNGSIADNYTVPEGRILVITAIHITPQAFTTGATNVQLQQNSLLRHSWRVPSNEITQINFAPGLLYSAGSSVAAINSISSESDVRFSVYGYEVTNR